MARVSNVIALDELQKSTETAILIEKQNMDFMRSKAMEVLSLLAVSPEFNQLFLVQSLEDMSSFVFTKKSDRTLVLDMLARCPREQVANFETYKFSSHPEFEKKITQYTRTAEKPNNQLAKCRAWDVALKLVLKVEALDAETMVLPYMRLLFRENLIIKHMWDYYMRENMELDEMTGIPLVFKYDEIPNPTFNYDMADYKVFDPHGSFVSWKSESRSTLSYMCMEQMGPNVQYLMDVMVSARKRGSCVFDMDTTFKIFDQLLCRCLQIHRFGVVHNAIEPCNMYFGRNIAFNVLYLLSFSVATVFDPKDPSNMRKSAADNDLYGSLRFASQMRLRGAQPHPVHDLESAFYTLIAMLTNLPWDSAVSAPETNNAVSTRNSYTDTSANNQGVTELKSIERNSLLQKLREAKANFWRSPAGIARVLADLQYLAVGSDRGRVALAAEIIRELYGKIRDLMYSVGSDAPVPRFFSNLLLTHTSEYQMYTDLRRTVLMLFRFESISAFINTPSYQKKIESLAHDEQDGGVRIAWNLTNWCFNGVEMKVSPNSAATSLAHSTSRTMVRNAR